MLGDRLGRKGRAHVTLIEKTRTHFWKPHLHEIAAGVTVEVLSSSLSPLAAPVKKDDVKLDAKVATEKK